MIDTKSITSQNALRYVIGDIIAAKTLGPIMAWWHQATECQIDVNTKDQQCGKCFLVMTSCFKASCRDVVFLLYLCSLSQVASHQCLLAQFQWHNISILASQSLAIGLFVQQLVEANTEQNIKALHYCPFVTGAFPSQKASKAESVSLSWHLISRHPAGL